MYFDAKKIVFFYEYSFSQDSPFVTGEVLV